MNSKQQSNTEGKVFNDPIHGHIEMHPLLVRIIDTPQFQHLRFIKQLGGAYFVYPGATHTRFEHSISVAHLAGELVKALAGRQPELQIDNRDILCVQIAGLCHDLGHGPFSHLFDQKFIPQRRNSSQWKHEDASEKMFEHLISSNDLEWVLESYALELPQDVDFIKELFKGAEEKNGWPYKGRPQEKSFLYEIVANKRTGIDVDKWDYLARDSYYLGIQNNFDYQRILKYARVCEHNNMKVICIRDKVVGNLQNMFYTRSNLYRTACQHQVVNIIESMITEAMVLADPHILISSGGNQYTMSTAIDDMKAYTKLTDRVFELILSSSEPELKEAQTFLNNIINCRLYKCIGQTQYKQKEIANLEAEVVAAVCSEQLEAKDLIVNVIPMNYGMNETNPMNNVLFYCKSNPAEAISIRREQQFQKLSGQLIQVYCKKTDRRSIQAARRRFAQWCRSRRLPEPWFCCIYLQDSADTAPAPMSGQAQE